MGARRVNFQTMTYGTSAEEFWGSAAMAVGPSIVRGAYNAAGDMFSNFSSQDSFLRGSQSQPSETSGNTRNREDGIEVDSQGHCKRARYSNTQTLGVNDFVNTPTDIIGAANSVSLGNNIEKSIVCKLNSSVTTPKLAYEYFLKHMLGSGRIEMTWAGSMNTGLNLRHRHYEVFRHNLYKPESGLVTQTSYPSQMEPYVLRPRMTFNAPTNSNLNMSNVGWVNFNTPTGGTVGEGRCFFPALNRADFEDMMWNLNRLKLSTVPASTGGTPNTDTIFASDVLQMKSNEHRGLSAIFQNNSTPPNFSGPANPTEFMGSKYRYNAVFKNGTVTYQFMNKGAGPAKIEIVVLKVRKQGQSMIPTCENYAGVDPEAISNIVYNQYEEPTSEGYLATVYSKFGTDDLNGRVPEAADVLNNARFPFIPKLKKTVKADVGFTEVQRISFIATAGSRRNVKIQLGGDVYDPANVPQKSIKTDAGDDSWQFYPQVMDSHSYVIGISTCGCRASRIVPGVVTPAPTAGGNPSGNPSINGAGIVGDVHSDSLIQYYASYVEEIGAMAYKDPGYSKIFVGGAMIQPDDAGELSTSVAGIVLPQSQTVRVPASHTTVEKGLRTDISSEDPHIYATSSTNNQAP